MANRLNSCSLDTERLPKRSKAGQASRYSSAVIAKCTTLFEQQQFQDCFLQLRVLLIVTGLQDHFHVAPPIDQHRVGQVIGLDMIHEPVDVYCFTAFETSAPVG